MGIIGNTFAKVLMRLAYISSGSDETIFSINAIPAKLLSSQIGDSRPSIGVDIPPYLECYSLIAPVKKAIDARANSLAGLILRIKDKNGNDISDDDRFRVLYYPNFKDTQNDFWKSTEISKALLGRTYWLMQRNSYNGKISAIYNLRADQMQIIEDPNEYIKGYKYYINGKWKYYNPEQIFFSGNINPLSDYPGLSSLRSIEMQIELFMKSIEYNRNFFKQGGRPTGILSTEQDLSDVQAKRYAEEVKILYQGIKQMHRLMILGKGLTFTPMNLNPKDMEFREIYRDFKKEIGSIFGVPPNYMDDYSDSSVVANSEQMEKNFWNNTMIPLIADYELIFTQFFIPKMLSNSPKAIDNKGCYAEFDLSTVAALQYLQDKQVKRLIESFAIGGCTPNEIRKIQGLDIIDTEEMNSTYIGFNMMPLSVYKPHQKNKKLTIEPNINYIQSNISDLKIMAQKSRTSNIIGMLARLRASGELRLQKMLKSLFDNQAKQVLAKLRDKIPQGNSLNIITLAVQAEELFDLLAYIKEFENNLNPIIYATMIEAANQTIKNWNFKIDMELLQPNLRSRLGTRMANYSQINTTTLNNIQDQLTQGVLNKENITQLTDRVKGVFEEASQSRAQSIAVTETTYAQNSGIMESMKAAGVKTKTWLSSRDSNVREAHMEANIQPSVTIPIDDQFLVGGEYMSMPGEGSLAKNNIRCRCRSIPGRMED